MKISSLTLAPLTILLVMQTLLSGCVYRPDFAFPAPLDAGGPISGPMAKAVIPELPYSMTWTVNAQDQDLVIVMDRKAGAFSPFSRSFWSLLGTESGAHPIWDKAEKWRFTLFAPDYTKICEGDWQDADSNTRTVTCPLTPIKNYYTKGLTAQIDYIYDEPKNNPFPFLSMGRTFYVLE